jgi:hypothetical protein
MKKTLVALLCLAHSCFAIAQETSTIHTDSLLADLEILATTIRDNHPMMFHYTTRERFENLTQRTAMQFKKVTSPNMAFASMSAMVSSIGCGHTYLYPYPAAQQRLDDNQDLPFDIAIIGQAMYLSRTHSMEFQKYAGAKLNRINEVPIDRLISSAYRYISSDGSNVTYKTRMLEQHFSFYLNVLMGNPDSLYIESSAGNFLVRYPTMYTSPEEEEAKVSYQMLPDVPRTVVLTVPNFDDGKATIKKCFAYVQKEKLNHLIIDLRGNGGGNGNIGAYLASFVIDSTLTYFLDKKTTPLRYPDYIKGREGIMISNRYTEPDSMTRRYAFAIKPQKKAHFDGQLYVLIDGGTFSTGAFVASVLKHRADATMVGEETGGSEYGIGGGVIGKLELPYTGFSVRFPLYAWWFNTVAENKGRGVMPDVPVSKDPAHITSETDLEMEKVIELIRMN